MKLKVIFIKTVILKMVINRKKLLKGNLIQLRKCGD